MRKSNLSDEEVVSLMSDPQGNIRQHLVTVCRAYGLRGEELKQAIDEAAAIIVSNPNLDKGAWLLTRLLSIHLALYHTDYNYDEAMELLERAVDIVTEDSRFKGH